MTKPIRAALVTASFTLVTAFLSSSACDIDWPKPKPAVVAADVTGAPADVIDWP
ncbi:hypothetical protein [Streptomyces jumonjinensis]|uniref:hypothetical protein n=1 Tax=Streptomyces jumonjinensis TaxID=1945 RepID=UPI00129735F8|nr:hypothetical protein [Streptomyces jumonjinensis]